MADFVNFVLFPLFVAGVTGMGFLAVKYPAVFFQMTRKFATGFLVAGLVIATWHISVLFAGVAVTKALPSSDAVVISALRTITLHPVATALLVTFCLVFAALIQVADAVHKHGPKGDK